MILAQHKYKAEGATICYCFEEKENVFVGWVNGNKTKVTNEAPPYFSRGEETVRTGWYQSIDRVMMLAKSMCVSVIY